MGVGLNLTRAFHMWLIRNSFPIFSFYSRPGRNFSPDFLSIADSQKVDECARINGMSRISPRGAPGSFFGIALSPWQGWNPDGLHQNLITNVPQIAEWKPGAFCLPIATMGDGVSYSWIDPRRARISRLVENSGLSEYPPGTIHFMGGMAYDFVEAERFARAPIGTGAERGLLITHLLDLTTVGFIHHKGW